MLKNISDWLKDPKYFIFFEGSTGIGKTYFCAALINFLYENKKECRYFTGRSLLEDIRIHIKQGEDYTYRVGEICDADFLFIDDLGSNLSQTDWQSEVIFEMLDKRYTSQLPTIITTNLNKKSLEALFSERATSRLYAKENIHILLNSDDRRI